MKIGQILHRFRQQANKLTVHTVTKSEIIAHENNAVLLTITDEKNKENWIYESQIWSESNEMGVYHTERKTAVAEQIVRSKQILHQLQCAVNAEQTRHDSLNLLHCQL